MPAITTLMKNLNRPTCSLELTQPKEKVAQRQLLKRLNEVSEFLDYVSLTNHASQGLRLTERIQFAQAIQIEYGLPVLEHVTVAGMERDHISTTLAAYQKAELTNLLVIKGDDAISDQTLTNSAQLLAAIRQFGGFDLAATLDLTFLGQAPEAAEATIRAKQAAGAQFLLTQPVRSAKQWQASQAMLAAQGIELPLVAGILPSGLVTALKKWPGQANPPELNLTECQLLIQALREQGVSGWHIFNPKQLTEAAKQVIMLICQEN